MLLRDIKPEIRLVDCENRTKLRDFGTANFRIKLSLEYFIIKLQKWFTVVFMIHGRIVGI
jgi:serine/threonine protein kinase